MRFDRISYSKIYPTSSFLNERIGIEIIVEEGGDPKEALRAAKQLADEFNKEANPNLYKFNETALSAEEAAIVKEIEIAPTLERLSNFKTVLTQNTKPYYLAKLKSFTDAKK